MCIYIYVYIYICIYVCHISIYILINVDKIGPKSTMIRNNSSVCISGHWVRAHRWPASSSWLVPQPLDGSLGLVLKSWN